MQNLWVIAVFFSVFQSEGMVPKVCCAESWRMQFRSSQKWVLLLFLVEDLYRMSWLLFAVVISLLEGNTGEVCLFLIDSVDTTLYEKRVANNRRTGAGYNWYKFSEPLCEGGDPLPFYEGLPKDRRSTTEETRSFNKFITQDHHRYTQPMVACRGLGQVVWFPRLLLCLPRFISMIKSETDVNSDGKEQTHSGCPSPVKSNRRRKLF